MEPTLRPSVDPTHVLAGNFSPVTGVARIAVSMFRVLTGQFDPRKGIGLANTSLAYFGGMLLALCECDLPYSIYVSPDDGDILTIGRHDFDKRLSMWMTAHPKKDPDTGEMFAFRCGLLPPFLTYFVFDADGTKRHPDVPIFSNMRRPSFVHDFAITKKYALFCDIQLGISGLGGASPITCDPEHILEDIKLIHCSMEKVRIDLKSGTVSRTQLSERNLELGAINPAYLTKRNRYAYMGLGEPIPKISGVVKLDLELGKTVATRVYGPGCFGGEPFFVPSSSSSSGQGMNEEDDGYVVSYVHDEVKGESKFLVLDAKSPELDVVASVKLPRRVPYGFHGLFVSEDELKKQRPVL
ncbi:hypothetical protein QJS10_CPB20g00924 [Acorus calamus]|uniref:Uncharacterized protein n=1 Tax=Acorus calamus TaxID=4465 RepID=A0AAV9C9D3_ACOCL|nr:hypothetical protein QJS10_CPB20g00924 [Acorus calamus]